MKTTTRLLSLLLSLVCLLTMLPLCVSASVPGGVRMLTGNYDNLKSAFDIDALLSYILPKVKNFETDINLSSFKINVSYVAELASLIKDRDEAFAVSQTYSYQYSQPDNYITTLKLTYIADADTAAERDAYNDGYKKVADELVSGIKGNGKLNDMQKALLLHDRLALYISYNKDGYYSSKVPDIDHSGQGALVNRRAVCDGYAKAYRYLLALVGIESEIISSATLGHAWNIVYIDGKAYYVDVTWDDYDQQTLVSHKNFLRSYNGFKDKHNATDYITTPNDTLYDDYFWNKQYFESSFVLVDNDIYYFDVSNLKKWGSDTALAKTNNNLQYLITDGTDLFYTKSNKLCRYNISNGVSTELWEFKNKADGKTLTEYMLEYSDGVFTHTVTDASGNKKTETLDYKSVITSYKQVGDYIYMDLLSVEASDLATALGKKVYGSDGKEMSKDAILYTGCKVDGGKLVVIKGDVNGDGKLTTGDLTEIKRHIQGYTKLSGAYAAAAGLCGADGVNIVDYVILKRHIDGKAKIYT